MSVPSKHASQQARKQSQGGNTAYVVWVFDQGREVYDSEQMRRYAAFVSVEEVWVDGAKVADSGLATQIASAS